MYVRSVRCMGGKTYTVGRFGIVHIDINDDVADVYTAGGNIITKRVKRVLDGEKKVTNSRNAHKNLY